MSTTTARRSIDYWRNVVQRELKQDFHLDLTPYRLEAPFDYDASRKATILQNKSLVRREYFFLPGHIHRWIHFYGTIPSIDSWVWASMPDGRIWYEGYQQYGSDVISKLTI